ncbi:DUF4338 domain-containing protein [Spirosoma sp. KCTC 42546]|nr:DUF4338 domain-containing protein [Spirosoma sp. KCTC 42546]
MKKYKIRNEILSNLSSLGISWDENFKKFNAHNSRETQKKLALLNNGKNKTFDLNIKQYIAKISEINPQKIEPILIEVKEGNFTSKLWSYALTFWSVPVSAGYGRRIRFIVLDKQNNKIIGIFGLCDPLISSNLRDNYIGWNREQRLERLYSCLTAYVLGAVPPYNHLLGSKLIALCTMMPIVRETFKEKYSNKKTIISGKIKKPDLVFIDTYGAFQKSSIYNKLLNWNYIGYTKGKSYSHIITSNTWELIREFIPKDYFETHGYGQGSSWKLRVLRIGLQNIGLNHEDILSIGWKRAYYIAPLAINWREFLTMKAEEPIYIEYTQESLLAYWQERWLLPREDRLIIKANIAEGLFV